MLWRAFVRLLGAGSLRGGSGSGSLLERFGSLLERFGSGSGSLRAGACWNACAGICEAGKREREGGRCDLDVFGI